MNDENMFDDKKMTDSEWRNLLQSLIDQKIVNWKEIVTLVLGSINPSQVGTSLASSPGFKANYKKGKVMPIVMNWFYQQVGQCVDCGTRIDLQADHEIPKEFYPNKEDADFIDNMVLRCRRHNVIKRPSHHFGGQTHLTTEAGLMWILFQFRPRTLSDFIRMCRLYGMTMADIRMQEGWAMAHWLQKAPDVPYTIESQNDKCQILQWQDGGLTRCWENDIIPNRQKSLVKFQNALPNDQVIILAYSFSGHVVVIRQKVSSIPFSHYFTEDPQSLAYNYTPPDRGENTSVIENIDQSISLSKKIKKFEGAKFSPILPRGMKIIAMALISKEINASVSWRFKENRKEVEVPIKMKRICKILEEDIIKMDFRIHHT
jgi:hypothetical protein